MSTQSPPTILVCDDEVAIRAIVSAKLRGAGFHVVEARNGQEALALTDFSTLLEGQTPKLPEPIVPDLVVTDLQMPVMSGLDLALRLKEFAPTSATPIIMLTARGYIAQQDLLGKTNIKRLMPKPFSASQLLEQALGLLGLTRSPAAADLERAAQRLHHAPAQATPPAGDESSRRAA